MTSHTCRNLPADVPACEGEQFYRDVLVSAAEAGLPFLIGGAAAFRCYTGIFRDTKDLDFFLLREHVGRFLEVFAERGYKTELTHPHWLGKIYFDPYFVDLIYSAGNGIAQVDAEWFTHSVPGEVLGIPVRLAPVEEILWSKGFVQERERYDGADVAHLLRARGDQLDWRRLLRRFDVHWRVLLGHLILFGFSYSHERGRIPAWVMEELLSRLAEENAIAGNTKKEDTKKEDTKKEDTAENGDMSSPAAPLLCRGTLLSREQYLVDVQEWGLSDARLTEHGGRMDPRHIAAWTAAIDSEPSP